MPITRRQPNRPQRPAPPFLSRLKSLKPQYAALLAVLGVAILGAVLTLSTHAATFVAAVEAESGQLSGNYGDGPTAGASGGASVNFGKTASSGGGGSTAAGADGPADPSKCTQTAAATFNWGEPQYASYFNTPTLDPTWHPYGPEPGHQDKGTRTPAQVKMNGDGTVSLNSDGKGTTAAMSWFPGQRYGRWEVCMKVLTGEQHYVLLTWPDADDWPQGGELDFAEESGGAGEQSFFQHCAAGGNCAIGSIKNDAKQWASYALEWTPTATIGYVNGKQFFKVNNDGDIPRPMHLCIQLDWFENPSNPDAMIVDYAKQWPVQQSTPSTLGLTPGEPATGTGSGPHEPHPLTVQQMRGTTQ